MAGEENEKTSFKQLIQGMVGEGVEVLQGIVKSESPLKIQIVNDEKLVIGPNITYVPRHLTDYQTVVDIVQKDASVDSMVDSITTIDVSHNHFYSGITESAGDPSHEHEYSGTTEPTAHSHSLSTFNIYRATMTVYNALKIGELVHVLSFNHGKQYYVLDRIS